jgi:hypothetical protein
MVRVSPRPCLLLLVVPMPLLLLRHLLSSLLLLHRWGCHAGRAVQLLH